VEVFAPLQQQQAEVLGLTVCGEVDFDVSCDANAQVQINEKPRQSQGRNAGRTVSKRAARMLSMLDITQKDKSVRKSRFKQKSGAR
jgi:hypothetical protein